MSFYMPLGVLRHKVGLNESWVGPSLLSFVLFFFEAIAGVVTGIICIILFVCCIIVGILSVQVSIFGLVLMILGIVNAVNGQAKQLPLIGGITILK